jgi:formylglycine-generating enzyme required for sulfatase activity
MPRGDPAGEVVLDESGEVPRGMVRVSPTNYPSETVIPGYDEKPGLTLGDYWIDKYEVTNRQFKMFVDQGGYKKPSYWKNPISLNGRHLSWDLAMTCFRDKSGEAGPMDWIHDNYPPRQGDFPVTGISWYEAAAYAEFAGKSLPTLYHWNRAAGIFSAAYLVPASNVGRAGILPVGTKQGIGPWGTLDMAGNVKEWVWNEGGRGTRYVLGGAWDEPDYMFTDPDARLPMVRASNIGFRCVKYIAAIPKEATDTIQLLPRKLNAGVKPISDEVFRAYRSLYSYDKLPLNASTEPYGNQEEDSTAEKVSYNAAYGNERASAYLFLPRHRKPPFQTVVIFPGETAFQTRTFSLSSTRALDLVPALLKSGRAVLFPVYRGSYDRGGGTNISDAQTASARRDLTLFWVKDASRAIDYTGTRSQQSGFLWL